MFVRSKKLQDGQKESYNERAPQRLADCALRRGEIGSLTTKDTEEKAMGSASDPFSRREPCPARCQQENFKRDVRNG